MTKPASLTVLFSGALFLSAVLMFVLEPMFTKMVLPVLGGSPAVWNTAVMFFQGGLLAGYLYVHFCTRLLQPMAQAVLHLILLIVAFGFMPISLAAGWEPPTNETPVPWLIALLTVSVGMPFFAVSATAPLLQRWFAYTGHPHAHDPYFLYSASNLGALLALVCYPVVIEPVFGLNEQSHLWAAGYIALAATITLCAVASWRSRLFTGVTAPMYGTAPSVSQAHDAGALSGRGYWPQRLHWMALAFVPSAMLLAVTLHISIDIAAAPFIWVGPLALYLLSFVIVFARRPILRHQWMLQAQVWVYIGLALYFTATDLWLLFGLHVLAVFVTSMACHGELAKRRPEAGRLTEFYLWMSLGGWLGGIFGALVAPSIFDSVAEYPLLIILACLLRPSLTGGERRARAFDLALPGALGAFYLLPTFSPRLNHVIAGNVGSLVFYTIIVIVLYRFRGRPLRFAIGIAVLIFGWDLLDQSPPPLARERSFFGVYEVQYNDSGQAHLLTHGTTIHGAEAIDPAYARLPLTYYNREGPLGQVIEALNRSGRLERLGVIGLGTGTIACYLRPGQTLTFYEIDPVVERIARNPAYFRYLELCGKSVGVKLGDGRRMLAQAPDGQYDLLVLDAFSSDAIPLHLLTREALGLYFRKISSAGVVMFHISNQYVRLSPVLADLAADMGLQARMQSYVPTPREIRRGAFESDWVVMARSVGDIAMLDGDSHWQPLAARSTKDVWTDDYSNLFGALLWERLLWRR